MARNDGPVPEVRAFDVTPGARSRAGAGGIFRGLLLSEYFILYLTIAYFLVMAVFFPDLVTPRNLSNQLSNVWPLLAVAIGQTFVLIIMGIDLSQGAIMGFVSVAGALVMATGADPAQVPDILKGFTFLPMADQTSATWLGGAAPIIKSTAEFLKTAGRIDATLDDYSKFVNPEFASEAAK